MTSRSRAAHDWRCRMDIGCHPDCPHGEPGRETTPEHLTFRVADGQRCFANCPACAAERETPPVQACPFCRHDLNHHDQPDCWDCTNAGTFCDSEMRDD